MISHAVNRQNRMAELREASIQRITAQRAQLDISRSEPGDWRAKPYSTGVYEMQTAGKKYALETTPGGLQGKLLTVTEHSKSSEFNLITRKEQLNYALNIRASRIAVAINKIRSDQTSLVAEELKDPARVQELATAVPEKIHSHELVRKGNELKTTVGIMDPAGYVISFTISASRIPNSTGYTVKNYYLVEARAQSQFGPLAGVEIRGEHAEAIYKAMQESRSKK